MLVALIANAAALVVAAWLVPGIYLDTSGDVTRQVLVIGGVALIFGVLNSLVKPILKIISLPFIVLTLGLFLVVINAALLMLTAYVSKELSLGFFVDGWQPAILGAIVVSIVSALVGGVLKK